jgi:hypothetical protein
MSRDIYKISTTVMMGPDLAGSNHDPSEDRPSIRRGGLRTTNEFTGSQ